VLWVDDNGSANRDNAGDEEGGYTIDNWRAVGVAPMTNWIAYNDHVGSAATAPNATIYSMMGRAVAESPEVGGPLKDFASGSVQTAGMVSTATGTPDYFGSSAYPDPGIPAYDLFNGIVEVGNANSMIGVRQSAGSTATITFNNLDPEQRYSFRGTSVRGNNYARRWTLCTLEGVNSYTNAHSPVGTHTAANFPSGGMTANQVAFNSGENRADGALVGWDNIDPGPDGSFSIKSEQYAPATLPNGETPDLAVYGYAINAMYLAEIGAPAQLRITLHPQNTMVYAGSTVTFTVAGQSSQTLTYQWQKANPGSTNFTDVAGATGTNYTTPTLVLADSGSKYRSRVSIPGQTLFSLEATLTVLDTPVLVAYWPFNDASDPAKTKDKIYLFEGVLEGGAAFTSDAEGRTGLAGDRAMDFGPDSGGQLVRINQVPFLNAAAAKDQITIAFWQKLVDVAATSSFFWVSPSSSGTSRGIQAHLPWTDNNIYFDTAGCCGAGTQRINSNVLTAYPAFDFTTWHHFVFVKVGATKQIWIDGVKFLEGNNTAPLPSDFTELILGADATAGNSLHGAEDDFAVFQGVLLAPQIAALAGGTAPDALSGVIVPTAPLVGGAAGSPLGYRLEIRDSATKSVNPTSVSNTLDGAPVSVAVNKVGQITTVSYTGATLFPTGSTHTVIVDFKDTLNQAYTATRSFTVGNYTVLPAAWAVTGVNLSQPGFRVWPYQTDGNDPNGLQPNSLAWTEDQLLGLHGPNIADLAGADAGGFYTNETVVNYSIEAGFGTERGNFTNDTAFPGIPGTLGTTGNSAVEVLTYVSFPAAGAYRIGANTDDGFRVTAGPSPRDKLGLVLGQFDGGRGAADTLFDVAVTQAGIYPMRLIWENGNGELPGNQANCEWFTVAADGTKILINDAANPVKAYRLGPVRPFVKSVSPAPGAINVAANTNIVIVLEDGATQVQTNTITLTVNEQPVTPTISKVGALSTITYESPGGFAEQSVVKVGLTYGDNSGPPVVRSETYSFTVGYGSTILFAINDTMMWRYSNDASDQGTAWRAKDFVDSAWSEGAALLAAETGATIEPIRTDLFRTGPAGEQIITDYFRGRFNLASLPFGGRLLLRYMLDDGAVFYINGVEVHRLGTAAATVVTATTLFTSHEGRDHYDGPVLIVATNLVVGENVMAVEVHQATANSSDTVFGAELSVVTSMPTPAQFTGVRRQDGNVVLEWTGGGTLQSATNVTGPYADVAGATSPYSAPATEAQQYFRVRK